MSRYYEMTVTVAGYDQGKRLEILAALDTEWNWEDITEYDNQIVVCGRGSLCGGRGEDEFALEVAQAIWKANSAYCEAEVCATYLEELPFERYTFDEEEYEELTQEQKVNE